MHTRLSKNRIEEALEDTRVILIAGPHQSGKTTLVTEIASKDRPFLTLDDATQLHFAKSDPVGFLRDVDRAVISEVQRAPELFMAIKAEVDKDQRPGRYLLTGSANLMTLPRVSESLAGRMEVIQLLPLSQAEIKQGKGRFLDDAFSGKIPISNKPALGKDLVELVLTGGYPEVLERTQWPQRQSWHLNYVNAVIQRDTRDLVSVEKLLIFCASLPNTQGSW